MSHQIVVDQAKGIIRLKHSNCVKSGSLWDARKDLKEKLKDAKTDKILMDMRDAELKLDNLEKAEFSDGHKNVFGETLKIALLIRSDPQQYKDYHCFETLYQSKGINLRVFDNEYMADEWLMR